MPHLCPVVHFCALALADGAFHTVQSADQLQRVKKGREVKIKDDMKDVPVLRRLTPAGHVSMTQVFTADSLGSYLRLLGERAGYMDPLTPYVFRRGHANKLDQMVSSVHRRQRMGHVSDDTMQYYISSVSGVDTQSIMLDRAPMQSLIDHLRSMANRHDAEAPVGNGFRLTDVKRLGGLNISAPDGGSRRHAQVEKRRLFDIRRSQRKTNLRHRRKMHFERKNDLHECEHELESDSDVLSADVAPSDNPYAIVRTGPSPYLLSLLRYEPARNAYISLLSANVPPTLAEAIAPLKLLADITPRPVHYQDAYPNDRNGCPRCDKSLDRMRSKLRTNRHLLACAKAEMVENSKRGLRNSFETNNPGACQWSCCSHSFGSSKAPGIARHLTEHVKKSRDITCWWQGCQFSADSQSALETHLLQQHGLYCTSTLPTEINYCYECGLWVESRATWDLHCDAHLCSLSSMGSFCGQITRHGLIVVAAKCIFCLGQSESLPSKRFHQYADCCDLHRHVQRHLAQVTEWLLQCPHPYCNCSIAHEENFWLHLTEIHGIEPKVHLFNKGAVSGADVSSSGLAPVTSGSDVESSGGENYTSVLDAPIMSRSNTNTADMIDIMSACLGDIS